METNQTQLDNCLKLIFPTVFGVGSKSNQNAQNIFLLIIEFLKTDELWFSKKKERQALIDLLTKASPDSEPQTLHILFQSKFACAVILSKKKKQSPVQIHIVAPQQWASGANDWRAQKLEFWEPKNVICHFLPQTTNHSSSLKDFCVQFQPLLSTELGKYQNKQQSTSSVEQACKTILEHMPKYTAPKKSTAISQDQLEQQQNKNIQAVGKNIDLRESETNTCWYVPQAVLISLIRTSDKYQSYTQKLILGFKSYILLKVVSMKKKYDQQEVASFKKCLDQIIFRYKVNISKQKSKVNRVKDFRNYINAIDEKLKEITKNGLTSRIQDSNEQEKCLKYEEPGIPTFAYPEKKQHQKPEIKLEDIQEYPLRVDNRLPFQKLLQLAQGLDQKDLSEKHKWVLLTERTFFSISANFANEKSIIDLLIHMREIECQFNGSNLCRIVERYQDIVSDDKIEFGMGMQSQTKSHIQLIKVIASVIAFESVKMNREKRKSNLKIYKIPIDIQQLHRDFISHSYQARKAMLNLVTYSQHRKLKRPIFKLQGKSDTYAQYARIVAQQTRSAHIWVQKMKRILNLNKQLVYQKVMFEQSIANIDPNPFGRKNIYSAQQALCLQYNQDDPWLFAFFENIPPDILGLIKILMIAQNPKEDKAQKAQNLFCNHIQQQENSVKIYSKIPHISKTTLCSAQMSVQNVPNTKYFEDAIIIFEDCSLGSQLNLNNRQFFRNNFKNPQDEQKFGNILQSFLQQPKDLTDKAKQHRLYSNLILKPEQLDIQDFLAIGNTRSAFNTKLMVLCLNILQKKVISNSYDQGCLFAEKTFLQTAGQLFAYDPSVQKYFKQITKLLKSFLDVWAFTDVNFCPIFGPFVGYISRQIMDDHIPIEQQSQVIKKVVAKLSKKCVQQYDRGQQQLRINPQLKIQWDQRFICTAAICCFREVLLTLEDQQQLMILSQLIFNLRSSKILSDREQKPKGKRLFSQNLFFSVQKSIFYNIETISNFLNNNQENISKILKKIDPSSENVKWNRQNTFSFKGEQEGGDIYQINLFYGQVFKNGKQISALDKAIKQNPYFKQIFGQNRQFQVFQSHHPNYLRTKNHVNFQFKISQTEGTIFFEFSEDGSQIRHIFKRVGSKAQDQDIWILLPRERLLSSKCLFPHILINDYLAWYSEKRKCIVFRKPKFEEIFNACVVIHLDLKQDAILKKAFHIIYHGNYQNQKFEELFNIESKRFEQIILRNKNKKLILIKQFEILSRFEDPKYIFELKNKKTNQIQYLLYRYQIRFKLKDQCRLQSQTFFGYSLDYSFYNDQRNLFNRFPCLVLRKHSQNAALLNAHKRIVIVSEGRIQLKGKIYKKKETNLHFKNYKYQIHDFFGDLRGSTRQSIIFMSGIILSINDNIKISSIQMTPLEYSAYLINCCLSNRPLQQSQCNIISNIMWELKPPESIVLLYEALWKCSGAVKNVLPFPKSKQRKFTTQRQDKLMTCRTLYQKRFQANQLSYGQKISSDLLNYIGIIINCKKQASQQALSSSESSSDASQLNKNVFWRKVQVYTGQQILGKLKSIEKDFQQFQKLSSQMNIWNQLLKSKTQKKEFPKVISNLKNQSKSNQMLQEMIGELEESYDTFIQEEQRIQDISKKLKEQLLTSQKNLVNKLTQKGQTILKSIETLVEDIKNQNQKHPDVLTGFRPTLSFICFTKLLNKKNLLLSYFPNLTKNAQQSLENTMMMWLQLKTRVSSFQRIKIILNAQKIDIVSLMRQVLSPREQIRQKKHWLCFQAENKVQLWPSQLDTYKNLMNSKKTGAFCQLNMGEGKTQVIIPMMILECIYSQIKSLPRINLLSSLIEQARGNFFRFLSATGFQLPGFQLPFTRQVLLKKENIYAIRNLIDSFSNSAYVLMTRQSRLSQVLRYYEINKTRQSISMQKMPIFPGSIFDIFDEIDALMTPVKSYIFSIGQTQNLPSSKMRFQILQNIIECFLKNHLKISLDQKLVSSQQTQEDTLKLVQKGQYPPGLRLNFDELQPVVVFDFRRNLVKDIITSPESNYFSFTKWLKPNQLEDLIEYIINPQNKKVKIPQNLPELSKDQIYLMRGAFGYAIFEHCLSMRCGVDYGAPNNLHKKRIAVPYQAADIPSKTSEYQQPDVSIFLSYFAYYTKGLNRNQFQEALRNLLALSRTSKQLQYKNWFSTLSAIDQQQNKIKNSHQINYNSKAILQDLFNFYKNNRKTISFWLINCVFPTNLKQYKSSICASAFDLADVEKSVGFSGTKDNHWLYSDKLVWKPCQTPAIKGTDGKMIYLIAHNTVDICLIQQNQNSQWQRFVDFALQKNVDCIIDAGALCVGKSLEKEIVPYIAEHEDFNRQKYPGISFCDQNGKWKVYDIQSKYYIPRRTTIPDHQTFVIFDEARTRGADLKMNSDVIAAISLGPHMAKDKFMQAAGRLRRLGRDQKLIIMATQQIFSSLPNFPKQIDDMKKQIQNREISQLANLILAWCVQNSVKSNQNLLLQFSNLGWNHIKSKVNKKVYEQSIDTTLSGMYSKYLQRTTVSKLNEKAKEQLSPEYVEHETGKQIIKILSTYGKNVFKNAGTLDDVCERQIEAEKQLEKEQQDALFDLEPIPQKDNPKQCIKLKDIPLQFDDKFIMSQNFIETTKKQSSSHLNARQLGQVYFVTYTDNKLRAITLRQASIHIKKHIIDKQESKQNIDMLCNLDIEDQIIKSKQLQGALVSAKYLSGIQNFTVDQQTYLIKMLLKSSKNKKQWQQNFAELTSAILRKKRIFLKKYIGSTLQKMVPRLQSEKNFH